MERFSLNTHWKLAEDLIQSKLPESLSCSWYDKRKKKKIRESGWDLHPWEGAVWQERCSHPSPAGGAAWTAVCRTERCAHRVLATILQSLVLVQTDLGKAQGGLCGDNQGCGVCVRPWAQVHRRSPSSGQSSLRNWWAGSVARHKRETLH